MPEPSPRNSTAVHEARQRLVEQGWQVTRWSGTRSPPDLFALRKDRFLLLMVRHSRRPLPDAHAVVLRYRDDLDRMRAIGAPAGILMECWVLAPPDGWKCYEILPGGIRRCWRKGIAPEAEDTPGPEVDECAAGLEREIPAQEMEVDKPVKASP
jgi:hypothetical protein